MLGNLPALSVVSYLCLVIQLFSGSTASSNASMFAEALSLSPSSSGTNSNGNIDHTRPTVLVTGSTDGIGVTTAKNLLSKGYNVLIHGRSEHRIQHAKRTVQAFVDHHSNDPGTPITLPAVDISTVNGCEQLVEHVKSTREQHKLQLSVIMNNAGVFSEDHVVTSDGLELTFAVNVMAPFVITSHLLPLLLPSSSGGDSGSTTSSSTAAGSRRIVIASSISQSRSIRNWDDMEYSQRTYSAHSAYSESKLLDAMLTMEFASRLKKNGYDTDQVTCNCLDPGTVNTKMLLAGWGRCGIDVNDALDETWLCSSNEVDSVTGKYFVWQSERTASSDTYNEAERTKMWNMLSRIAPKAAEMWNFK